MKKILYLIAIIFPFFIFTSKKISENNKKLKLNLSKIFNNTSEHVTESFEKLTLSFSSKKETNEEENKPSDSSMVSKNLVFPSVSKNLDKKNFIFAINKINEKSEEKKIEITKKRKMGYDLIHYEEFDSNNLEIEDQDLKFKKEKKIKQ